jgi:hypothetical protein
VIFLTAEHEVDLMNSGYFSKPTLKTDSLALDNILFKSTKYIKYARTRCSTLYYTFFNILQSLNLIIKITETTLPTDTTKNSLCGRF